ncbi:MAG: Na+/H+ antiporter NhaC family protein [Bacteroidales bacterium]|jgi:Na+/H+ antiporter NhaC|nr:Na+/H+ antiporter NhaC family protein [Bacteroidales bacterium]
MQKKGLKYLFVLILPFLVNFNLFAQTSEIDSISIQSDQIIVSKTNTELTIYLFQNAAPADFSDSLTLSINKKPETLLFENGIAKYKKSFQTKTTENIEIGRLKSSTDINPIPLWFSILPPLIAILFALIFKEVFSALILGIFSGTLIISLHQGLGVVKAIIIAFLRLIDTYIIQALNDKDHLSIIVFSLLIGGMVGIITRNGGMRGLVRLLSRKARTSRSGQLVTWIMGIAVFFDDYANTLVVGNTMRNVTDKLKVSREKLAYIVDSTAAPMAAIAFITTWIGAELSYIQNGISTIGLETTAYSVFFASLKYSFYPLLTLAFVFILIMLRRDYGPMYKRELKARGGNQSDVIETKEKPEKRLVSSAWNGILPVMLVVFGTIAGLIFTGWDASVWSDESLSLGNKISHTIGQGNSFEALLWASFAGVLLAITITVSKKLLNLKHSIEAMVNGFKSMLTAILILTFAWALALLTEHLHTADFISHIMQQLSVSPPWIPAISFVFSAFIAFSTGSSWGTMAIMYPLMLPTTWLICMDYGLEHEAAMAIFNNVVSTVIAGSVLGDHISPISDTTILSSLASGCNHIDHVQTQMPYALTVGAVALILGIIPSAFGVPFYLLIPLNIAILYGIIRIFGKKLPITKLSNE